MIRDWAQTAEGLGYDYILTHDHVLGAEHADRQPRLAAAGRARAEFGFEASLDFSLGEAAWREEMDLWAERGGTHVALRAMNTGHAMMGLEDVDYPTPRAYIDALETFMRGIR